MLYGQHTHTHTQWMIVLCICAAHITPTWGKMTLFLETFHTISVVKPSRSGDSEVSYLDTVLCHLRGINSEDVFFQLLYFPRYIPQTRQPGEPDTLALPRDINN